MIISVASGKGGTGKTTIAVNLAVSIGGKVALLDCDVEEPNAHLFIKPEISETRIVTTPVPEVDLNKCTGCGLCGDICQFKAIAAVGDTVLTFPELCHGCGGCMKVCPEGAVTEVGRELGRIDIGARNGLTFAHGVLRVGEAMSPPLIREVKKAVPHEDITIIDAPPGTSCPVIAAMRGADVVLLVTEPTPFGLHDLKLAVGAVKILGIPAGLIINRSDIGTDDVTSYAARENLPVLMEIPFDRKIAEIYSNGDLMADAPRWREKFQALYQSIISLTG